MLSPSLPRPGAGPEFWAALDQLVAACSVVLDRPRGSRHPRYPDLIYPLDYGYLSGTQAGDGGGVDVWMGGSPAGGVTGVLCTVDLPKRDVELKLLLGCTPAEAQAALAFHNDGQQKALLLERDSARQGR
jgi:inorganic pyrophosphatase